MRTTLLVCAWVASIAVGTRLLAQDCGMSCQDMEPDCGVSEISIMFKGLPQCACPQGCPQASCTCARQACNEYACNECGCDECVCNQYGCSQAACDQSDCDESNCEQSDCEQAGCDQGACNQDDCSPYTYYQLREDWRKAHGPILNTVRCLHNSCPFKHHHKCNGNAAAQQRAAQTPWHGNYYYPQWGGPVALVVPPTAEFQSNYSWGVPASRISPIDAQFSRKFPGYGAGSGIGGSGFLPPPQQPSDTNQFGVYYVRGPW